MASIVIRRSLLNRFLLLKRANTCRQSCGTSVFTGKFTQKRRRASSQPIIRPSREAPLQFEGMGLLKLTRYGCGFGAVGTLLAVGVVRCGFSASQIAVAPPPMSSPEPSPVLHPHTVHPKPPPKLV